jgi:hypothetical protein
MSSLEPDLGPITLWRNGLLLTLLAWLLTAVFYHQAFDSSARPQALREAFTAARLVAESKSPSIYPSLDALAMWPLDRLPLDVAIHLWFFLCVISLLFSIGLFALAAGIELHDAAPLGIMMIIGFRYYPTALDFWNGQFNLPVLALLCAAYLAGSRDRMYWLAACLAGAALMKPWMIGFFVYLLIRRRPLAFIWGIILYAGVAAALLAKAGWHDWARLPGMMLHLPNLDLDYGFANQSILGFARVHFGINPDAEPWVDDPIVLYSVVAAGFLALLCGLWLACRRAPAARGDRARLLFGLVIVSLLLALPYCRPAYFVFLLPVFWTLLTADGISGPVRAAGVAVYALFTQPFESPHTLVTGWDTLAPSAFFFANVALWMVMLAAIRRRRTV